jgi:hypothetical protein
LKKLPQASIIVLALLLMTTFGAIIINPAAANPISPWNIHLNSPQNNMIYPSNMVTINFDPTPFWGINVTSFSYSLDDQVAQPTNGSTILTGLTDGTHKLTLYSTGNFTRENQTTTVMVAMIHFSVVYSPAIIVFTTILIASLLAIGVPLYIKRKPILVRLRGYKTIGFWLGLPFFVFSSIPFFIIIGQMSSNYMFPHAYTGELVFYLSPLPFLIFGLILMLFGLTLMIAGTSKNGVKKSPTAP